METPNFELAWREEKARGSQDEAAVSLSAIIGREHERRRLEAELEAARQGRLPKTVLLSGVSGIGKTAVLRHTYDRAAAAGWTTVWVACHRIQSKLPFAVLRSALRALLDALGGERDRYAGALQGTIDAALANDTGATQSAFVRILDGVTLDGPVFVAVDDAQWADRESMETLSAALRRLADRAIFVCFSERSDEPSKYLDEERSVTLAIDRFAEADSRELARTIVPDAAARVVQAIVEHANGHALDILAIAEAAKESNAVTEEHVDASVRVVVANRVRSLPSTEREFLQLCSLIPEPIEFRILRLLWPDQRTLLASIDAASKRYLVQRDDALYFVHAGIAESIRETMPIEIPYRKRIIEALSSSPAPSAEDCERIIEQALACGDTQLAQEWLISLTMKAGSESALAVVLSAAERALRIGPPPPAAIVPFYMVYASALGALGRPNEAADALAHALRQADANAPGIGGLASVLALSQWNADQRDEAIATYDYYVSRLSHPMDLASLHTAALWFYVCTANEDEYARIRRELESVPQLPPPLQLRVAVADGILAGRSGDVSVADEQFLQARQIARDVPNAMRSMVDLGSLTVGIWHQGIGVIGRDLVQIEDRHFKGVHDSASIRFFRTLANFCTGAWDDIDASAEDALDIHSHDADRRRIMAFVAATAALRNQTTKFDAAIERDVAVLIDGRASETHYPLAAWHALRVARTNPSIAGQLIRLVVARMQASFDPLIVLFPAALALAARRANDEEALRLLAAGETYRNAATPWDRAQIALAQQIAAPATKPADAEATAVKLEALGAPVLAELARTFGTNAGTHRSVLLQKLGVARDAAQARKGEGAAGRTSARERQIAALVAEGHTNRAIAELLVLSERTVEAHISNLFNKVGVSSRTQLANWYLRL